MPATPESRLTAYRCGLTSTGPRSGERRWRPVLLALLRGLARATCRLDVRGREHVPAAGRLIVYFNHVNFLDAALVCACLGRPLTPISKEENLTKPLVGGLLAAYGTIAIRRGEVDLNAFRCALDALEREQALLIAPEGTRSGDGRLQEGKDGMIALALRTQAFLLPVALIGQEAFRGQIRRLRRTRVQVQIGQPFRLRVPAGLRSTRDQMHVMTTEAMQVLAALLPPAYQGLYAEQPALPAEWIGYGDE